MWILLLMTLSFAQTVAPGPRPAPAAPAAPPAAAPTPPVRSPFLEAVGLRVQKLHVPAEQLGEWLLGERAFPRNELKHTVDEADLDRRVDAYNARSNRPPTRRPIAAALEARLDPATFELTGRGVWRVPAGAAAEVVLAPWNAAVSSASVGPAGDEKSGPLSERAGLPTVAVRLGATPAGELVARLPVDNPTLGADGST
ncbi:MAG: hypothetical protein ACRDD1_07420, partial [Planctomycetia bacterium]